MESYKSDKATYYSILSANAHNCEVASSTIAISHQQEPPYLQLHSYVSDSYRGDSSGFIFEKLGTYEGYVYSKLSYQMDYSNKLRDQMMLLNVPNSDPETTFFLAEEHARQLAVMANEIYNELCR